MQNLKARWPDDTIVDSDATSKETLEDVEENEKSSDAETGGSEPPSPDGALDGKDERRDEGRMKDEGGR